MGVEFEVIPSNFNEKLDDARTPQEVAEELALGKALAVAEQYPDAIVIGSDTVVAIEGRQLEKPRDTQDAKNLLILLSGKVNEAITGLAVVCKADDVQLTGSDAVKVKFKPYDESAIDAYIATGDSMDKAGAYGIQSGAAPLIEAMDGNYDTIIGLPTHLLAEWLQALGIACRPLELHRPVKQLSVK